MTQVKFIFSSRKCNWALFLSKDSILHQYESYRVKLIKVLP